MYDPLTKKWLFRQNGHHGRRAGDLEPLLHRTSEGRVQSQQGDDRLRRMGDGALAVHRCDHSAACRRHQVARLRADRHCSGISVCSRTCCRKGRRSRATTIRWCCARGGYPLVSDTTGTLLHVAMNFRAGDVDKRFAPASLEARGVRRSLLHQHRKVPGESAWRSAPSCITGRVAS